MTRPAEADQRTGAESPEGELSAECHRGGQPDRGPHFRVVFRQHSVEMNERVTVLATTQRGREIMDRLRRALVANLNHITEGK